MTIRGGDIVIVGRGGGGNRNCCGTSGADGPGGCERSRCAALHDWLLQTQAEDMGAERTEQVEEGINVISKLGEVGNND